MTEYAPELKAQVIADASLGMSKSAIARKYKIPRGTVQTWLRTSEATQATALISTQKKEDLGQLVYDYLVAGLKALNAQAVAMGDPEWFKKQEGTQHLIHGTLADKLVIIFGGVERGTSDGD